VQQLVAQRGIERPVAAQRGRRLQLNVGARRVRGHPAGLARGIAEGPDIRIQADLDAARRRQIGSPREVADLPLGQRQHAAIAVRVGCE